MTSAMILIGLLLAGWGVLALVYRAPLAAAWREPVLRHAVLILESDDWGPGPDSDGDRLRELATILAKHRDGRGRAAVATIGVVLSLPDAARTATGPGGAFARLTLADPRFRAVREALAGGAAQGVFSLQLHAMEHYRPASLLEAASRDPAVERWIRQSPASRTEALPAALQMRWVDGARLPSQPLPAAEIEHAADAEVAAFTAVFGRPPAVAVPPTFVWDDRVEAAWADRGIRTVVTPGRRFVGRDTAGRLVEDRGSAPYNGRRCETGVTYVVRDRYFEPAHGHRAEDALGALEEKTRAGRPALLETHRANFIADGPQTADALQQIDRLLGAVLGRFPEVRFMATDELASALLSRDAALIERRLGPRLRAWLVRLAENSRLKKLACLTGLAVPAWLVLRATRPIERGAGGRSLRSQSSPR
jgi:hypothetical protein